MSLAQMACEYVQYDIYHNFNLTADIFSLFSGLVKQYCLLKQWALNFQYNFDQFQIYKSRFWKDSEVHTQKKKDRMEHGFSKKKNLETCKTPCFLWQRVVFLQTASGIGYVI